MSKYMVNKFMRFVEMSDEQVARYKQDSPAYVIDWMSHSALPAEASDEHQLTVDEAEAFSTCDYGRLYELGAHPYLLWHFVEAVFTPETTWPALNEQYREAVQPHGYPDYVV